MGGPGSGRLGGKPTIGRTRSYVLSTQLLRESLQLGRTGFQITFRSDCDEVVVEGAVETLVPAIAVEHLTRCEPRTTNAYAILLDRTYPYGGGVRWWFLCPQTGRRAAKLYLPLGGRYFLSRQAYGLVHDTRQMSRRYRLSSRVTHIASKLGDRHHDFFKPPDKPHRMRWRTYERLVSRWYQARDKYWRTLNPGSMRIISRHGKGRGA